MSGPTMTRIHAEQIAGLREFVMSVKEENGFHVIENCVFYVPEDHAGAVIQIDPRVSGVRIANNTMHSVPLAIPASQEKPTPTVINFDAYCTLPPTVLIAVLLIVRWIAKTIQRGRLLKNGTTKS